METKPDFLENIVRKAVEIVNLGNAGRHGATELVARHHTAGPFAVESLNSKLFDQSRKITIRRDGKILFQAVVQAGWEKRPDRITLAKSAKEPANWREDFLAAPISPAPDNDS